MQYLYTILHSLLPSHPIPLPHLTIFSTQIPSNLLTSSLKTFTSLQQSNGLLSFSLKHFTNPSFALSTPLSTSFTFFLSSNFRFSCCTSFCTLSLPISRNVSPADFFSCCSATEESLEVRASKSECARSWRDLSSEATRDWMWSSRVLARVESLCC